MQEFRTLRPLARAYVSAVVLLGVTAVAYSVWTLYTEPIGRQWLILAALTLLTGSFTVKVPSINASLSVSETFVFASVLLFGPAAGAITVLLECLIILFWMKPGPGGRRIHRVLFNTAAPAISIWVSGSTFFLISGTRPSPETVMPLEGLFLPLVVFTALYFLLNSWLVALALGFETRKSPLEIWWRNFTWLSVNYFSGASVAALLVTYQHRFDLSTLAIIVPLLVVSYLTFRTAMGRVEDASHHLTELNRLYLSTIETLAMAIDAKDQVTHGHIRRVQIYATGLARAIGVKDERLIKAIEAAALLHDMGKLAVPEYILNKPGKLTPAEFEKMKLHASVGADILSAIDFPYPVVPIVRHHHENWDGTGYPAGLRGTDIPIGARILAVVDCFDALTSDRPYRPRLSDSDGLQILMERRGSMYDPLVVDTFVRVHASIAPEPASSGPPPYALDEIASARKAAVPPLGAPGLDEIAASTDETLTLYELARDLNGRTSPSDAADLTIKHLRRRIPCSLCVFFVVDEGTAELEARYVVGAGAMLVKGLRVPLGQRLSGWVAANRQTILNSDPVLDFGEAARSNALGLKSCISTPMIFEDDLTGVLSLYAAEPGSFSEDHRRIIEAAARHAAHIFRRVTLLQSGRDSMPRLPDFDRLLELIRALPASDSIHTLLLVKVCSKQLSPSFALQQDGLGKEVAKLIRNQLPFVEDVYYDGGDQFGILLASADHKTADATAVAIRASLDQVTLDSQLGAPLKLEATVTILRAPIDTATISQSATPTRENAFEQIEKTRRVH